MAGMILTNQSLETCLYEGVSNVCKERDMPCLGDQIINICENSSPAGSSEQISTTNGCDEIKSFLTEQNLSYDNIVSVCNMDINGNVNEM